MTIAKPSNSATLLLQVAHTKNIYFTYSLPLSSPYDTQSERQIAMSSYWDCYCPGRGLFPEGGTVTAFFGESTDQAV